jgi:ketosteroid isomerase-like protein
MAITFDTFFATRQAVTESYVCGDGAPLDRIVAHEGQGTFHGPGGDTVNGAAEVAARYREDAGRFAEGSTTRLEVLQKGSDGDLAFWTGFQIAKVMMKGKDEPVDMRIRVTEVFRREGDEWKMVVRHADMGTPPKR